MIDQSDYYVLYEPLSKEMSTQVLPSDALSYYPELEYMYYEDPPKNYILHILGYCFAYFCCTAFFPLNMVCGICTFKYMNMDEANNYYFKLFIGLSIMITSLITLFAFIGSIIYGIYYIST